MGSMVLRCPCVGLTQVGSPEERLVVMHGLSSICSSAPHSVFIFWLACSVCVCACACGGGILNICLGFLVCAQPAIAQQQCCSPLDMCLFFQLNNLS